LESRKKQCESVFCCRGKTFKEKPKYKIRTLHCPLLFAGVPCRKVKELLKKESIRPDSSNHRRRISPKKNVLKDKGQEKANSARTVPLWGGGGGWGVGGREIRRVVEGNTEKKDEKSQTRSLKTFSIRDISDSKKGKS